MTVEEKSWILYDVANSAFVLIVITTVMPIFFKDVAARGIEASVSTAHWGFANSLAALGVAIMAPLLGALADYRGRKKTFLVLFLGLGVLATLLLALVGEGRWLQCLALYGLARIGFSGTLLFYDAFLVDVTPKNRMDWVSACGYAWGYVGGTAPFVVVVVLIALASPAGGSASIPPWAAKTGFVIAALWWLLFSVPLLKNVRQKHYLPASSHPLRDGLAELAATFRKIRTHRNAFIFLVAYFFYIDGVDTIITMASAFGRDIGLGVNALIPAFLMTQLVAFPFALLYGRLAARFSTRSMLYAGIAVYAGITLIGYFLPAMPTLKAKVVLFWLLAFLVATSMGGIQALSRSFFGRLIPARHAAEFFGFYNIFGKFAAIMGPFLMGLIGRLTGETRYGILAVLLLFAIGAAMLARVDPEAGRAA